MKKNLLFLFTLGGIFSTVYGQDTYINDAVVVKVNPNTLFYNGGSVNVNTPDTSGTTEKIINQGNIQIQGGFTNTNETGKNFVNEYTSDTSYGQLIIKDQKDVTGKVSIERSTPDTENTEYLIALPFKNSTAEDVINSLTGSKIFKGDCTLDTDCGSEDKYVKANDQTMRVWDVAETEYDAVVAKDYTKPGYRYILRFRDFKNINFNSLANAINGLGTNKFQLAAIPNNNAVSLNLKSGILGFDYSLSPWSAWKDLNNHYGESYDSYLGNQTGTKYDNDYYFGKNLHRLGNPFTSNLDLSDVSNDNTWIKFKLTNDTDYTSTPVDSYKYIGFKVYKNANDFTIKSTSEGNITNSSAKIAAYLYSTNGRIDDTSFFWAGDPQALIIKPYETFYVYYGNYSIDPSMNNNSTITNANVSLGDKQKTFDYNFEGRKDLSNDGIPGIFNQSATTNKAAKISLLNNETLKAKGLAANPNFYFTQLELFLSKDNLLQGSASYLLNGKSMVTGDVQNVKDDQSSNNTVYFFEEDTEGNVLTNAKTLVNQFNSEDYRGKPIRVGFNNLEIGQKYKLNLNMYEYSILNKVKNFEGINKYYLLDKIAGKWIDVDDTTEITFTADDNVNDRFEFYWMDKPAATLGTDDLNKTNTTYLYTDSNKNQFIRFEQSNTTANIAVFDLTGRQIFSKDAVSTNSDYQLNMSNIPSVYVVKITYKDGKTVTKKTIKK